MQQIQRPYGNPLLLLETSASMLNTERVHNGYWPTDLCRSLLQQVGMNYSDMFNTLMVFYSDVSPTKHEALFEQKELLVRLLRETWGPFLMCWNRVFFKKNLTKSRRWVRKKQRKVFQSDFTQIQAVVVELCDALTELNEKAEQKPPPKRPINGIN